MGKKSKSSAIPKTIAGVKVPKKLRKAGDKAVKLAAEHPVIGDIVAAGLLAAAAALTGDKKLRDAARAIGEEADETAAATKRKAGRARSAAKAAAGAMGKALIDELGAGKVAKKPRNGR